jgi:hypothetical protein
MIGGLKVPGCGKGIDPLDSLTADAKKPEEQPYDPYFCCEARGAFAAVELLQPLKARDKREELLSYWTIQANFKNM